MKSAKNAFNRKSLSKNSVLFKLSKACFLSDIDAHRGG